jgi:hypothetical protein
MSAWTDAEKAELVEAVLDGMAEGQTVQETVKERQKAFWKAGKQAPMSPGLVRGWIRANPTWWERYQQMKPVLGQALAEEALRVARDSTVGTSGIDRVLIDTLKWAAAKANPIEFGDKQTVEHQGSPVLQVKIVEDDVPVRNPEAMQSGVVSSLIQTQPILLSAPLLVNPSKSTESDDEDELALEVQPVDVEILADETPEPKRRKPRKRPNS